MNLPLVNLDYLLHELFHQPFMSTDGKGVLQIHSEKYLFVPIRIGTNEPGYTSKNGAGDYFKQIADSNYR